ncbi:MAG: acyltransferase family protein [Bacteroidota bacterium]|jgi:peptidoglycan/LPS O-acetylase OafA/YrhL
MEFKKLNSGSSTFLNLARVVSAQFVVIGHLIRGLAIFPKIQPPYIPFLQGIGVVVFFILSGFLIPYSTVLKLKQNPKYSFKEFFIERFSRIFISLVPCLLFIVLIDLSTIIFNPNQYHFYDTFNIKNFIGSLLMLEENPFYKLSNLLYIESFGSGRPFWTLAIEWWIYFWFGFLYLEIINKQNANLKNIFILAFFSIVPFSNFISGRGEGLMLPWCCGTLIFIIWPFFQKINFNKFLVFVTSVFLLYLIWIRFNATQFRYVEPYYVLLLSFLILVLLGFSHHLIITNKMKLIIQYFADFSFTLYLIHYTLIYFAFQFLNVFNDKYLFFICCFLFVNLVSISLAKHTEMKYKILRSYLIKKFIKK